jgi:hypothetical protein
MNLLPLDTWFELMGFNRWHAWGFADNDALAVTESCDPVLFESANQIGGSLGREDIREAIEGAENLIHEYASFWPAPKFYEVEQTFARLSDHRFSRRGNWNSDWRWRSMRVEGENWIAASGIEGLTPIQLNAPVSLLDPNNDGYFELFQIGPIPTTLTDASEIACYFNSNDRWDSTPAGDKWRVEPITADIVGGQLTIRGRPWLIGLPLLSQGLNPQHINPVDVASFASSLDVYRRFVDRSGILTTNSQAVVYWETRPSNCNCYHQVPTADFSGAINDPAAVASATARVGIRDGRRGVVTPAQATYIVATGLWESFSSSCTDDPDRVLLRLYAGYPSAGDGRMDKKLRDATARLTAAELQQEICGCAEAQRRVFHWQADLSKVGADKQLFASTPSILNNPLGTRRGHWFAWNAILDLGRISGTVVG